jgi:hypothetical protein
MHMAYELIRNKTPVLRVFVQPPPIKVYARMNIQWLQYLIAYALAR